MKKIVVPNNLTPLSNNSFEYGFRLAYDMNFDIDMYYIFSPHVNLVLNSEVNFDEAKFSTQKRKALEDIKTKISSKYFENEEVLPFVDIKFINGFLVEQLSILSSQADTALIVMGSGSEEDPASSVSELVTLQMINNAKCPLLIVPLNTHYSKLINILFAFDTAEHETKVAWQMVKFAKPFGAMIHLVHVGKSSDAYISLKETLVEMYSEELVCEIIIDSDKVTEAIGKYAKENDIDLIVLDTKHRSLINQMFHSSISINLTKQVNIPLLILRDEA